MLFSLPNIESPPPHNSPVKVLVFSIVHSRILLFLPRLFFRSFLHLSAPSSPLLRLSSSLLSSPLLSSPLLSFVSPPRILRACSFPGPLLPADQSSQSDHAATSAPYAQQEVSEHVKVFEPDSQRREAKESSRERSKGRQEGRGEVVDGRRGKGVRGISGGGQ